MVCSTMCKECHGIPYLELKMNSSEVNAYSLTPLVRRGGVQEASVSKNILTGFPIGKINECMCVCMHTCTQTYKRSIHTWTYSYKTELIYMLKYKFTYLFTHRHNFICNMDFFIALQRIVFAHHKVNTLYFDDYHK